MKKIFASSLLNFWLFISFILGEAVGHSLPFFRLFFISSLFSAALVYFSYKRRMIFLSDTFILLLFLFLGASWMIPHIYKVDEFLDKESAVSLTVVSLPQKQGLKNTFTAEIKEINAVPVKCKVKVFDFSKKMDYLNSYLLEGRLKSRIYRKRKFYRLWVKAQTPLKELSTTRINRFTKKGVNFFLRIFERNLSNEGYRFIASVFLGRRELLGDKKGAFFRAGTSHLLAISGLHIGLTSLILFFILRLFNLKFKASLLVSVIFLYLYTLLTGVSSSTLRAVIMYSLFSLGFFLKRKVNTLNSLGLAGFISLIINPPALFEVGFQLSFLSVFAIILGFGVITLRPAKNPVLRYAEYIFFSSIFVTVFISPLVSYYFGRVNFLSIIYNIVVIPFFATILVVNFIFIFFSPFDFFAQATGTILSLLVHLFNRLIFLLSSFKASSLPLSFSLQAAFIYYLILGAVIILLLRCRQGKKEESCL